jgi:PilZ domain-containing protein
MSLLTRTALVLRRRGRPPAEPPPAPDEVVWVGKARSEMRARGHVTDSQPGILSLALAGDTQLSLQPRTRVELEWIAADGLVRARGKLGAIRAGPPPLLEIAIKGKPRLVERRADLRVATALEVSGWSPHDPTRLLAGRTVDLSSRGALLLLPMTPETATTLDLRISLPDGPLAALGHVVRPRLGDLVAVRLEPKRPADWERLAHFVAIRLQEDGVARTTAVLQEQP